MSVGLLVVASGCGFKDPAPGGPPDGDTSDATGDGSVLDAPDGRVDGDPDAPQVCTPGQATCDGRTHRVCSNSGETYSVDEMCPLACSAGACSAASNVPVANQLGCTTGPMLRPVAGTVVTLVRGTSGAAELRCTNHSCDSLDSALTTITSTLVAQAGGGSVSMFCLGGLSIPAGVMIAEPATSTGLDAPIVFFVVGTAQIDGTIDLGGSTAPATAAGPGGSGGPGGGAGGGTAADASAGLAGAGASPGQPGATTLVGDAGGGGGGGGYFAEGGGGGDGQGAATGAPGGTLGLATGSAALAPLRGGSGGGGGGDGACSGLCGNPGGGGGGALQIAATTSISMAASGQLLAGGGAGYGATSGNFNRGGGGGGGSGGAILLEAPTVAVSGNLGVPGGKGGDAGAGTGGAGASGGTKSGSPGVDASSNSRGGSGGGGGAGRVRVNGTAACPAQVVPTGVCTAGALRTMP